MKEVEFSCYGIPPLSKEEKQEIRNRTYQWIKALIEAEKLNPEPDYDMERERILFKQIAESNTSQSQRQSLIDILEKD